MTRWEIEQANKAKAQEIAADPLLQFFTPGDEVKQVPRLAISLDALDKSGKTHWALMTAPDPIALVTNDPGTLFVLEKARKSGRKIPYVIQQNFIKPDADVIKAADVDAAEHAGWKKEWSKFTQGMHALQRDSKVRTVVIDNATNLANLCELTHFGKLRGNARIDIRAEYNAAFTKWFWDLYKGRPDLNIIMIHQVKKEYKPNSAGKENWTGKYERSGFATVGYLVDFSLRMGWDGVMKDFYCEIDVNNATRFGSEHAGKRWYSRDSRDPSHFAFLGMTMFPETEVTPEYWGL